MVVYIAHCGPRVVVRCIGTAGRVVRPNLTPGETPDCPVMAGIARPYPSCYLGATEETFFQLFDRPFAPFSPAVRGDPVFLQIGQTL